LDGSPAAISSNETGLWAALTKSWHGISMICVARLADDANPASYPTGGSYGGEQLFFASLSSGFYLIWGATPGRPPGDQGALSAYRLDPKTLFALDGVGQNEYTRIRAAGIAVAARTAEFGVPQMLEQTVRELESRSGGQGPVLATNISGAEDYAQSVSVRSLAAESVWQAEFGAQPSPLGIVIASVAGDGLIVARSVWLAPLRGHGATERWQRDANGAWRLTQTVRAWSL
jgi:hypothetical protein